MSNPRHIPWLSIINREWFKKEHYYNWMLCLFVFTISSVAVAGSVSNMLKLKTIILKPEPFKISITSIAKVNPNKQVQIIAQVSGIVTKTSCDIGDRVFKGQVLAIVDSTKYKLELEDARAGLLISQAELKSVLKKYERAKELVENKLITQEKYEGSETTFLSTQATVQRKKIAVKIASLALKKTVIKAPFAGQIGSRKIEKDQFIEPGNQLFTMVDLMKVRVKSNVLENDYIHFSKNDLVNIRVEAYPGKSFKGRIDRIGIIADSINGTFPIDVIIDNPDLELKSGFTARVTITALQKPGLLLDPVEPVL